MISAPEVRASLVTESMSPRMMSGFTPTSTRASGPPPQVAVAADVGEGVEGEVLEGGGQVVLGRVHALADVLGLEPLAAGHLGPVEPDHAVGVDLDHGALGKVEHALAGGVEQGDAGVDEHRR